MEQQWTRTSLNISEQRLSSLPEDYWHESCWGETWRTYGPPGNKSANGAPCRCIRQTSWRRARSTRPRRILRVAAARWRGSARAVTWRGRTGSAGATVCSPCGSPWRRGCGPCRCCPVCDCGSIWCKSLNKVNITSISWKCEELSTSENRLYYT